MKGEIKFGALLPQNMTSGGVVFTDFPENQLITMYAFFLLVFLFISRSQKLM